MYCTKIVFTFQAFQGTLNRDQMQRDLWACQTTVDSSLLQMINNLFGPGGYRSLSTDGNLEFWSSSYILVMRKRISTNIKITITKYLNIKMLNIDAKTKDYKMLKKKLEEMEKKQDSMEQRFSGLEKENKVLKGINVASIVWILS